VQKAAAAVYTDAGQKQTRDLTDFYLGNAKLIREAVTQLGFSCIGGDNAPYIWVNTGRDSWEFFDLLLNKAQVVCTPAPASASAARATCASAPSTPARTSTTALARIAAALKQGGTR
jgi:LL-diaminopimelate aminotransferase